MKACCEQPGDDGPSSVKEAFEDRHFVDCTKDVMRATVDSLEVSPTDGPLAQHAFESVRSSHRRSKSRRKYSVGPKTSSSLGQRCSGRPNRSKSRRCSADSVRRRAGPSSASILQCAQQRLAQLEQQTALGLARLSRLESETIPESVEQCLQDAERQKRRMEDHIQELEIAQEELRQAKQEVTAEVLLMSRHATNMEHRYHDDSQTCKLEDLEQIVAEQNRQLMTISSQLACTSSDTATTKIHEVSQEVLVVDELIPRNAQTLDMAQAAEDFGEMRAKIERLEQTITGQAQQIMALSSKLVGKLNTWTDEEYGLKDRAENLAMQAESLRDDTSGQKLDLGHLTNVCAALFSERAANQLAALPDKADDSALSLLADLDRRFPLSAAEGNVICHHPQAFSEMAKLKLSDGSLWEAVD